MASKLQKERRKVEIARSEDEHSPRLLKHAIELSIFDSLNVCTIGIVGDSGVGKSSLINSILNQQNLVRTAGLGAACTSVVTEYPHRLPSHAWPFTISISRMTNAEISTQLKGIPGAIDSSISRI